MLKRFLRLIALLMSVCTLFILVGCQENVPNSSSASSDDETSSGSIEDGQGIQYTVSNMGGKEFFISDGWITEWEEPTVDSSESQKEMWAGIKKVENLFNCKITIRTQPEFSALLTYLASGMIPGDIIRAPAGSISALARLGYAEPLNNIENFGLDSQPWPKAPMELTTYFGKTYGFDYKYSVRTVMAYNKTLAEAYGIGDLYAMVKDGTWTFDKFLECCQIAYEKSGNKTAGVTIVDDFFERSLDAFIKANDASMVKEEDNRYIFNGQQEGVIEILNGLQKLYTDGLIIHMPPPKGSTATQFEKETSNFAHSRSSLFLVSELWCTSNALSESSDEFGYIPLPKGPKAKDYIGYYGEGQICCFVKGNEKWQI